MQEVGICALTDWPTKSLQPSNADAPSDAGRRTVTSEAPPQAPPNLLRGATSCQPTCGCGDQAAAPLALATGSI